MKIMYLFHSLAIFIFFQKLFFFAIASHQTPVNPRLLKAYTALQAWKHSITSDPKNFTYNWCGFDVCEYTGVYCAPALDDPHNATTVAGIDLNNADIAGTLPEELGLLSDLALFHINSNRFRGSIPPGFRSLRLLFEMDLSNNQFAGEFPSVILSLSSLKYLDIRYNLFEGDIPGGVFDLKLDALFVNNNNFQISSLPENMGKSTASVIVLANNGIRGCLPKSLGKMAGTLDEIILSNNKLSGCLPKEIGFLRNLTVFDIGFNDFVGNLPDTMGNMKSLEQLNVENNRFSGEIPANICSLPRLKNFTYSHNYFFSETSCLRLPEKDDRKNCLPNRPSQRSLKECLAFYSHPVDCGCQ